MFDWLIAIIFGFSFEILGYIVDFGDLSGTVKSILSVDLVSVSSGVLWMLAENIHAIILPVAFSMLGLICYIDFTKLSVEFERISLDRLGFFSIKYFICAAVLRVSLYLLKAIMELGNNILKAIITNQEITGMNSESIVEILQEFCSGSFWNQIGAFLIVIIFWILYFGIFIGALVIVFVRIFKIIFATAISPIPLSTLVSDVVPGVGRKFLLSYIGISIEGIGIYICCFFYTIVLSSVKSTGGIAGNLGACLGLILSNAIFIAAMQAVSALTKDYFS